jgi:hypothetical protein
VQYLVLALVLAIIVSSVVAWMRITGGDEGVADAELLDVSFHEEAPNVEGLSTHEAMTRHAVWTITSRRIPLLSVTRGPHLGQAWLHYADGTELLAEERILGALGFLAFDVLWHGPTPRLSVTSTVGEFWVTVGRHNTPLRLVDSHHPDALLGT